MSDLVMPERLVTGRIDGLEVAVPRETTILAAAAVAGAAIPTLCHHEGLPPDGNCRLCMVEIGGRLAASCLYPLRDSGFDILTMSPKVRSARRFVLTLLLTRAPGDPLLLALAAEYGAVPEPRFTDEPDGCLRCGRCARACAAGGAEAVSLVGRGRGRRVAGPFFKPPEACRGCLACAAVCPTGVIAWSEAGGQRRVWERDFHLLACESCCRPFATPEEWAAHGGDSPRLCPACRRRANAAGLSAGLKWTAEAKSQ
jgi:NADH dehydrogenase/NADH:ubiquinone oxidoreductase subunit G